MKAAVVFTFVILGMLAAVGAAIFTGHVDPLPVAEQHAQEAQLRNLVMSVFMIGALVVAWHTTRRTT